MKRYLILFVFLLVISGCQDEENIPVSSATDNQQQLDKKTKVVVCHQTGNGTYIPLEISVNALPAHLAHGDYIPDADGDGYTAIGACTGSMDDCNDADATINPGAVETDDGKDNNCNNQVDEGFDLDGDGFTPIFGGDCNDNDPNIHPGAAEVCDNIDNNCDGQIDEGFDNDGDDYTTCNGDCDDSNPSINPGVQEVCNDNIDNNCNGATDEGCGPQPCPGTPTVDYGGKIYNTVQIGTQCWLKENLDVGTRINGIQNSSNNQVIEKYCYGDDDNNCDTYGGLYVWDEMMQYTTTESAQGICPNGWHIPTLAEFQTLGNFVGGEGNALKAIGQGTGDGTGTNTSGFSALAAGVRPGGRFLGLNQLIYFWSSTEYAAAIAYGMVVKDSFNYMGFGYYAKSVGFSVRCIKD